MYVHSINIWFSKISFPAIWLVGPPYVYIYKTILVLYKVKDVATKLGKTIQCSLHSLSATKNNSAI